MNTDGTSALSWGDDEDDYSELATNQGALFTPGDVEYNGLRFRSRAEVRVAQALDAIGVMYAPLPIMVRTRVQREPDFLVLRKGRLGVLEIDGPHHTALTRAQEDARAAWFQQSGVALVRHVPVHEVDVDARSCVWRFLRLLEGPSV